MFSYRKANKLKIDCVGDFLCWYSSKGELVEDVYKNSIPEFFPARLVPFASNGGGDYICFDYRNCRENPPIVFWRHESQIGKDLLPIANSFDEFIYNLESGEEIE